MNEELTAAVQEMIRDLNWIKMDMSYKAPEQIDGMIRGLWFDKIIASVEKVERIYLETDDNRKDQSGL